MNKNDLHAGHRERMRKRFEENGFGLALLADLKLSPQTAECLYLMAQDELCSFMKTELIPVARTPDGAVDTEITAERIAGAAGNLSCRIVMSDENLLPTESAEELYRTVNAMDCRLEQILLTENGDLYLIVP